MTRRTEPRLVLHVGAMKTGTTYVQNVARANEEHLAGQGWYLPEQKAVVRATRQVLGLRGVSVVRPAHVPADEAGGAPRWTTLMQDVRSAVSRPGSTGAIVSVEFLSFARPAGVARILESTEGFDVHVVLTVRDAMQALPSQWGTLAVDGGYQHSWPAFAAGTRDVLAGRPNAAGRPFVRTQDVPRMIEAWSSVLPPERLTTITVPAPSRGLPRAALWELFGDAVGIATAGTVTDVEFDNPRLGYGTCELLRRVNAELRPQPGQGFHPVLRRLAREFLLELREGQSRPRLDRTTAVAAAGLNARTLDLARSRTSYVGQPEDLPVSVPERADLDPGDEPRPAPESEVRDAARAVLRGTAEMCAELGPAPAETTATLAEDLDTAVLQVAAAIRAAVSAGAGSPRGRRGR